MQRTVAPSLDIDLGFLIQLADGGGGHLAAPQSLRDVLYTAHGYACQVHLNKGFFHAALPAAIALDDGSLERDALETRHMECYIPGGGGKISVIMTAAVALAGLIALVAGCLGEFFCFGFLLDMVCCLLSECLCGNFILPETGKPCLLFYALFNLRILLYLI